jgi:hypothetical protein
MLKKFYYCKDAMSYIGGASYLGFPAKLRRMGRHMKIIAGLAMFR